MLILSDWLSIIIYILNVIWLFAQINRVEFVHSKSFLHRDIKPDNFLMGLGRRANQVLVSDLLEHRIHLLKILINLIFLVLQYLEFPYYNMQVYIIDFGLAKKYRDSSTHQHIPYR